MKNPLYFLLLVFLISCSADKPSERLAQECTSCVQQVSYYQYNTDGTTTLTDYIEIPVATDCSQDNVTVTEDIQISESTIKKVTKTVCD